MKRCPLCPAASSMQLCPTATPMSTVYTCTGQLLAVVAAAAAAADRPQSLAGTQAGPLQETPQIGPLCAQSARAADTAGAGEGVGHAPARTGASSCRRWRFPLSQSQPAQGRGTSSAAAVAGAGKGSPRPLAAQLRPGPAACSPGGGRRRKGGGGAHGLAVSARGAGGVDVQVDRLPVVVDLEVPHLGQDKLCHGRHQLQRASQISALAQTSQAATQGRPCAGRHRACGTEGRARRRGSRGPPACPGRPRVPRAACWAGLAAAVARCAPCPPRISRARRWSPASRGRCTGPARCRASRAAAGPEAAAAPRLAAARWSLRTARWVTRRTRSAGAAQPAKQQLSQLSAASDSVRASPVLPAPQRRRGRRLKAPRQLCSGSAGCRPGHTPLCSPGPGKAGILSPAGR